MAGSVRKDKWRNRKGGGETWLVDYTDQKGVRHTKQGFATRKAADAFLLRARGEVRDGTHTPDSNSVTVAKAAELWLQHVATNELERGSLRAYDQLVRLAVNPLIGESRLSRLTRDRVVLFKDELLEKFKRARARRALWALRAILNRAQDLALVAQNVAATVRFERRTRQEAKLVIGRTIPTPEEVRNLIEAAGKSKAWLRAMVTTAAFTGMRQGELRGLSWEDIDLAAGQITVRQRADQWGALGAPKSKAGQRVLDIAPAVVKELQRWRLASGSPVMVFPGRATGKVIGQSTVLLAFDGLQKRSGIVGANGAPKYVFHALRHFFASVEIKLGRNPKELQTEMGHEKIELTMNTYGHLFPNSENEEHSAAFEAFVLGGGAKTRSKTAANAA
jgi:integrase